MRTQKNKEKKCNQVNRNAIRDRIARVTVRI